MKNSVSRIDALNLAINALSSNPDAVATLSSLRDSIAKQNAYKPEHKTPTKVQVANEGFKADILVFLADGRHATVSEIIKGVPSLNGETTQKVSALMRLLKLDAKVDKETIKGKTYFFMV